LAGKCNILFIESLQNYQITRLSMKQNLSFQLYCILLIIITLSCQEKTGDDNAVVIENAEMRLVIDEKGHAKSLLHKATNQECFNVKEDISVFVIKQNGRLPGQEMLIHPYKQQFLTAEKVKREGDKLLVTFEKLAQVVVTIDLTITDSYIGFTVADIESGEKPGSPEVDPWDELIFLRLPVRDRENFGEWLNVIHDREVAVNVLGTDQYCRIDNERRQGFRILEAGAVDEVKTLGTGAALIVTETKYLLDRIDQVETDYNLPPGVKNRRREESKYSYYWPTDITPDNVDQHIRYAQAGGFRFLMISSNSFAIPASFTWLPAFSNGLKDLKEVVDKINNSGIIAGVHLYYTKADKKDIYVTGNPDHRLGIRKIFTLAEPITEYSDTITVEENPRGCAMQDGRRILKVGEELITYREYTSERPYQFTGCQRGHLQTKVYAREKGFKLGLLDVDTWNRWVRFDQRTSIQQEVAERIGEIYNQAGFQFIYLDGGEDVNPPYWYNISKAQKVVIEQFHSSPVFTESAVRSHFSWHITDRANAFDLQSFAPEELKNAIRNYPMREAPMLKNDFTKGEFGWITNYPPGHWENDTTGIQPDMIEFSTSRAAGWDTGTSLWTKLSWSESHPRTEDVLEVFRRWEAVRQENRLTDKQKAELRDPDQEHILLINENNEFELRPYNQILQLPTNRIRAFHFQRDNKIYVVYWNTVGEGSFSLPVKEENIRLFDSLNGEPLTIDTQEGKVILPAGHRRYLECTNLSASQIIESFRKLEMVKGSK
jgi:hypothetical protein